MLFKRSVLTKSQTMIKYLFFVLLLSMCGCRNIDSFEKYCDYLQDKPETMNLGFYKDKIKEDFVSFYNQIILAEVSRNFLNTTPEDSVVQFLYKNELIGVRQKGDDLYISNLFLYSESDSITQHFNVPSQLTFKGFTYRFQELIAKSKGGQDEMSEVQYGMFTLMRLFYKRIIIQGSAENGPFIIVNDRI